MSAAGVGEHHSSQGTDGLEPLGYTERYLIHQKLQILASHPCSAQVSSKQRNLHCQI